MASTGMADTGTMDKDRARGTDQESSDINVGQTERVASLIGGGVLAFYGLSRRSPGGVLLALLGGGLLYRGMSGHCTIYQDLGINSASSGASSNQPQVVEKSVTIERSPADLYRFWHTFENLPRFMKHLESVKTTSDGRSHWVAQAPLGANVQWDAEITEDRENELIAWRSLADADVYNAGSVQFAPATGGRGTVVKVRFEYAPPGGVVGATVAKLFGEEPAQQVAGDLRRFKQMMEAGEIATIEGQPSGRSTQQDGEFTVGGRQRQGAPRTKSIVREASEESFPASDPPAWTMGNEDTALERGA